MIEQPLLRAFYEQSDFFNTGFWTTETSGVVAACEALMQQIAAGLSQQPRTVLDVGCGIGGSTRWLLSRFSGAHVVAVNLSLRQTGMARLHVHDARFAAMDAARLAFDDSSFDTVVSIEAPFHFRTRREFLCESWRVLRPGGSLAVSDILFTDPRALGPGMVPEENQVKGGPPG